MFETHAYIMSEQQLREMALNAMLLAVDAQAAALKSMDREHSFGVENSFSVERLRDQLKDLVQSTHTIVRGADSSCINETREKIKSLASAVTKLKGDADRFKEAAQPRARARYAQLLMQMGVEGPKATHPDKTDPADAEAGKALTPGEVATDTRGLSSQAGFACLRAEVDEFLAFVLQIHASCNLALEYALNAAAKCARCNSNI